MRHILHMINAPISSVKFSDFSDFPEWHSHNCHCFRTFSSTPIRSFIYCTVIPVSSFPSLASSGHRISGIIQNLTSCFWLFPLGVCCGVSTVFNLCRSSVSFCCYGIPLIALPHFVSKESLKLGFQPPVV